MGIFYHEDVFKAVRPMRTNRILEFRFSRIGSRKGRIRVPMKIIQTTYFCYGIFETIFIKVYLHKSFISFKKLLTYFYH